MYVEADCLLQGLYAGAFATELITDHCCVRLKTYINIYIYLLLLLSSFHLAI